MKVAVAALGAKWALHRSSGRPSNFHLTVALSKKACPVIHKRMGSSEAENSFSSKTIPLCLRVIMRKEAARRPNTPTVTHKLYQ